MDGWMMSFRIYEGKDFISIRVHYIFNLPELELKGMLVYLYRSSSCMEAAYDYCYLYIVSFLLFQYTGTNNAYCCCYLEQ